MEIRYYKHYSSHLKRDMEFKIYGHRGKPVLFIPCQAGRYWDFESFKMIDVWAKWIEAGQVTVYSCDIVDAEAYANLSGDCYSRVQRHEQWYNYTIEELVPYIRHLSWERTGRQELIMTFGCSLGALHAANLFFRRPDLFDAVMAFSGIYDSYAYFGDYVDDIIYNNCPNFYLPNLPQGHHYIDMYNQRKIILCCGQGAWEDELKVSTGWLERILREKGINAWVDFWGTDAAHDWDWWYKQVEYFVPYLLGEKTR